MNVAAKLTLFGAALAVVFLAAYGVGATVGPVDTTPASEHTRHLGPSPMERR